MFSCVLPVAGRMITHMFSMGGIRAQWQTIFEHNCLECRARTAQNAVRLIFMDACFRLHTCGSRECKSRCKSLKNFPLVCTKQVNRVAFYSWMFLNMAHTLNTTLETTHSHAPNTIIAVIFCSPVLT